MESSSTEDPNKLIDPTATQPLLSSQPYPSVVNPQPPPPITLHSPTSEPVNDDDQSQFLQITYKYGPRPFKDWPFLILFFLLVLATFAFGIFACVHKNPHSSQVSSFIYNSTSSSCTLLKDPSFLTNPISINSLKQSGVLKSLIWTLVITLIMSLPLVLFVLLFLKHYTKQIVYVSLPFFVVVPVFINVYWFVACTVSSTCSESLPLAYRILVLVFGFLIIGVLVWIFVVNWHRIELTINIIGVAANALSQNLGLFGVLPSLSFVLFLYYAPIVVFLVFARLNGKIVPRERNGEFNCAWKQDSWVPAYYALAILTMLWSATAMIEAQVYVISGTIAQWYFSKDYERPKRSLRSALRNAFGPSSGTVCLSGLLVCVVRMVRAMVDNARHEDAPGIVNLIIGCCVNALMTAFDFLNKFTINFAAITGEAYCTSARMTYELLKRNLLSAAFVETVSTRILGGIVFVLSAIYAIVVCIIIRAVGHLGADAYFIAAMAWLLLIVVLGFFVHVLDNVIDTIYVCYAVDRDRGDVCKQEVHEVYANLPISRSHQRSGFGVRTPLIV